MSKSTIHVTQPSMPPLDEFTAYLEKIWDNKWLTNNGQFHQQLEQEIADYLGVQNISLFCNGTLALITALQALNITGEVITTPFSFVATTHSLWWNGIKPVFGDIDPITYNLDPTKVESLITSKTTAILPVHVYGTPCNNDAFQKLADKYNLKLIYDAAHAFAVKKNGQSILNYGDMSILSFHATKVFSTFEGGAIFSQNVEMKKKIDFLKNFGFADEVSVVSPGINAKMNEIQAAFGLLQLKYIDSNIKRRAEVAMRYREKLSGGSGITLLPLDNSVEINNSYFPILIDSQYFGMTRDQLYDLLKSHNIYTRRYFFPLISEFSPYNSLPSADVGEIPIANKISQQILCLPIYPDIHENEINMICDYILNHSL